MDCTKEQWNRTKTNGLSQWHRDQSFVVQVSRCKVGSLGYTCKLNIIRQHWGMAEDIGNFKNVWSGVIWFIFKIFRTPWKLQIRKIPVRESHAPSYYDFWLFQKCTIFLILCSYHFVDLSFCKHNTLDYLIRKNGSQVSWISRTNAWAYLYFGSKRFVSSGWELKPSHGYDACSNGVYVNQMTFCNDTKLSYRQKTCATLCISWDVGLLLYK